MQLDDVIVSGVTELVRIFIILEYLKIFLKVSSARHNIINGVITYIVTLSCYLIFHNVLINLIVTIVGIIFLSFGFIGKFQKKLLLSIMLYAFMFVIDLLASFLLYEAPDANNYDIVSSFISVLFFYIVVIGIKNVFRGKGRIDLSGQWYLLLFSALLSIAVLYVVYKNMVVSRSAVLTISIIILVFNFMLYIFYMSIFAGAIGAGLADLIGGYTVWVLPTIIIKSMWALIIGLFMVKLGKNNKIMPYIGVGVGAIFHICAYTLVRIFLYGISAALVALPGLIFQTVSGVVIFVALYVCVSRAGIKKVFAN